MADKIGGIDPNVSNPNNPNQANQAPVDPSNTSSIGQKVEQGVVDTKEGISEQSNEWEDEQERKIPAANTNKAEDYIKKPSPEEMNIEDQQQSAE